MTLLIIDKADNMIVNHIGYSQMHVLTLWQIQRIAGLIGIHHMLVVLQADRVAHCIIEREIDVMSEVSEDGSQMGAQLFCHADFCLRG